MKRFPKYPTKSHQSGQARIVVNGQNVYLGKHDSPESWRAYRRLLTEWEASQYASKSSPSHSGIQSATVAESFAHWLRTRGDKKLRDENGKRTKEYGHYEAAIQILLDLYAEEPLAEFRGPQLKAVMRRMVVHRGWSRPYANHQASKLKSVLRWLEGDGWLPPGTMHHLDQIPGLEEGEHDARDTEDVLPANEDSIKACLPHFNKVTRAIIELLLLTGARPSELLRLKPEHIDRTGRITLGKGCKILLGNNVWAASLSKHKTAKKSKGRPRIILFGPKAQAILLPFMDRPADKYLFSPKEGREDWFQTKRTTRKTSVQPSQENRSKAKPKKQPGERYSTDSLHRAVQYATAKAEKAARAALEAAGQPLPHEPIIYHWHPYMLRHNAATRITEEFDLSVAASILGHARLQTTLIYALENMRKAADATEKTG